MAGFLLKKATLPRRFSLRDTKQQQPPPPAPETRTSADAPPSLPPLILSTSLADPDPDARALPLAASPPVLSLPANAPEPLLNDLWDPWKAYADDAPSALCLDSPPQKNVSSSPARSGRPLADNTSNAATVVPHPTPVATVQGQQARLHVVHPKGDTPLGNPPRPSVASSYRMSSAIPAAVRGPMAPASNFDFEESLSAANVPSVVNPSRSYPPPVRHHTSPAAPSQETHMAIQRPPSSNPHRHHPAPQKPGSSSSLSSSSRQTDATRRTNGSRGSSTSASSVSPTTQVIHSSGRLDPVRSSHPNGTHYNLDYNTLPVAFSSSNASARPQRAASTTAPPTSYPERVRTLARQTSLSAMSSSSTESHARIPVVYDMLRSDNPHAGSLRKGPLIFAAMSTASYPTSRPTHAHNPCPSPPAECASLEGSSPSRRIGSSIPSAFRGPPQSSSSVVSPSSYPTELPPLAHKSSKSSLRRAAVERTPSAVSSVDEHARPRVLTKARPTTPQKPGTPCHKVLPAPGDPLLLDDDPFARVEGVKMLKPRAGSSSGDGALSSSASNTSSDEVAVPAPALATPPDDYKVARQQRRGLWLEKAPPAVVAEVIAKQLSMDEEVPPRDPTPPPTYFPIMAFLSDAHLLPLLLSYLSYSEWLALYSANNQIRDLFQSRILREFVLERYLGMVGYSKWDFEWAEPLALSLKDLHNYLRGVAMPTHEYARLSSAYLHPQMVSREVRATSGTPDILALALTTRAYTRVLLRLRAQAESEDKYLKMQWSAESGQTANTSQPGTRQHSMSSRAPSPTSSYSGSRNHSHGKNERSTSTSSPGVSKFRSPLYRPGRAPILRVFVPSPEGDWLSDASVVECEAELKRSGILKLLRVGDIVWDVAVGDEGNLGRLIWDGSYLVDLDYRYSRMGELSPYFHSLAFSPSYFHRVIRIGGSATHNPHCNPLVYMDVSPWGREIANNLQLLQDRARTETPHGALHDVVRWVHRSSFTIRSPPSQGQARSRAVRIPIPNVEGFYIDPGWYGTVILESEGTHEGLADLQARCGPGVFPPRAETVVTKIRNEKEKENRRVWRILREKSRPGEIWLRAVQVKERMM